jgi:hypothetical protein
LCETRVTDVEIRKSNRIVAQNLKKGHRGWENNIKVDFIEIFCKGVYGLTIPRVGAMLTFFDFGHE